VTGNWLPLPPQMWEAEEECTAMTHIVKNIAVINDKGKRSTMDILF